MVGAIGFGGMPLSGFYGTADPAAAQQVLERALDSGVTLWDTAEVYGHGGNEELLAPLLHQHRDRITIATKFGINADGSIAAGPDEARCAVEGSLRRLGIDHIDLYYVHRIDPTIPIEDTVGALADLVADGKVGHLGLSEASAATLRRAHAVHPIAALQSEWSLWTRDLEPDVLPAARELGVAIVPYSPLGRGLLTAHVPDTLEDGDHRRSSPRFTAENIEHNLALAEVLGNFARERDCSAAQIALAWLLAQGDDVIPIPGTRSADRVRENAAAVDVGLTAAEVEALGALMQGVAGARYARPHSYGDSPERNA
jgi:aryl-alcohol dehydrogenase-like predicted oxidoreductase